MGRWSECSGAKIRVKKPDTLKFPPEALPCCIITHLPWESEPNMNDPAVGTEITHAREPECYVGRVCAASTCSIRTGISRGESRWMSSSAIR